MAEKNTTVNEEEIQEGVFTEVEPEETTEVEPEGTTEEAVDGATDEEEATEPKLKMSTMTPGEYYMIMLPTELPGSFWVVQAGSAKPSFGGYQINVKRAISVDKNMVFDVVQTTQPDENGEYWVFTENDKNVNDVVVMPTTESTFEMHKNSTANQSKSYYEVSAQSGLDADGRIEG